MGRNASRQSLVTCDRRQHRLPEPLGECFPANVDQVWSLETTRHLLSNQRTHNRQFILNNNDCYKLSNGKLDYLLARHLPCCSCSDYSINRTSRQCVLLYKSFKCIGNVENYRPLQLWRANSDSLYIQCSHVVVPSYTRPIAVGSTKAHYQTRVSATFV